MWWARRRYPEKALIGVRKRASQIVVTAILAGQGLAWDSIKEFWNATLGQFMTRNDIENLIRHLHEIRKENDAEVIGALFAEDAVFGVAGCETSSGVACHMRGKAEFMPVLDKLAGLFHWVDVDFHSILIEGSQASASYALTFDYALTGARHQSDVTDIMSFRNGKISRMIQFADTAFLNMIIEQGAMEQPRKSA